MKKGVVLNIDLFSGKIWNASYRQLRFTFFSIKKVFMYNADTELLFPARVIPLLRTLRGQEWQEMIEKVMQEDENSQGRSAFVLMMVRLNGCISCNADSFRAMRGCTQCARQVIRRFRGSDLELCHQYQQALQEVNNFVVEPATLKI